MKNDLLQMLNDLKVDDELNTENASRFSSKAAIEQFHLEDSRGIQMNLMNTKHNIYYFHFSNSIYHDDECLSENVISSQIDEIDNSNNNYYNNINYTN